MACGISGIGGSEWRNQRRRNNGVAKINGNGAKAQLWRSKAVSESVTWQRNRRNESVAWRKWRRRGVGARRNACSCARRGIARQISSWRGVSRRIAHEEIEIIEIKRIRRGGGNRKMAKMAKISAWRKMASGES